MDIQVQPLPTNRCQEVADLNSAAFIDKTTQTCFGATPSEARREERKAYQKYLKHHPDKLKHCGVVILDGAIVGAIQVQLASDVGDLSFPSFMRHACKPGEAYIEWIGVAAAGGKGIGSKLLKWGEDLAKAHSCTKLTLAVVSSNTGAIALYERKGFEIQSRNCWCLPCMCCFVFCCMGARYTGVYPMLKQI
eukprot:TRINITY_DN27351_c0_g1_i1.p1 TRINITY_DN27351_c0_g1~~TRINITY_DN27351_c0_g1_i1.p1  ORF type:complete len:192 (+),score=27.13 TRINITY_DN27351_c0_g1_i1:280-855(+)